MSYPALWNSKEGIKTLVIAIVFEVLAVLAVISRIFSRRIQRTNFALNDYATFLALVQCTVVNLQAGSWHLTQAITSGLVSVLILAIFWAGTGHHVQEIAPDKLGRVFWVFGFLKTKPSHADVVRRLLPARFSGRLRILASKSRSSTCISRYSPVSHFVGCAMAWWLCLHAISSASSWKLFSSASR